MKPDQNFTQRKLEPIGKSVLRLGLTFNFGIDETDLAVALERGVNYLFWNRLKGGPLQAAVRQALARDRDRLVFAAGPGLAFRGGGVRRGVERLLRAFGTDYIDILHFYWLSRLSAWTESTLDEVAKLKAEGKIRAFGISIHDRPRAGSLAEDARLDHLMIRYNAAHPGAEKDIFPHFAKRRPTVAAYTATSWRRLLRAPKGWEGPAATAGDCYRFCLSSDFVDVVLMGPGSRAQLEENLAALEKGPLSPDEDRRMRELGRAVHG
jgi:aryl-alcohol dehydrogenase-like predicted oxidoreductase